ncbi:hypothetical protein DFH09DRAFT_1074828 [Mycena vulgaris]|nr:hypothetical protein DFH09DRAFT_1074828 [Mycena vulgaris]
MYSHRVLILHFGTLFVKLQYLTHTSVQFYPRKCWDRSIRNVSNSVGIPRLDRAPGVLWDILFILAQCPICKGDHAIPEYHEKRILRGLDRIARHLDTAGKRKHEHSSKENKALVKKLCQVDKGYERVAGAHEWEIQPAQPQQRRLSANQRLALVSM